METSSGGASPIDLGELALLGGGAFLIALSAFVFARLLRSLQHGFSVRLQLFAALSLISLLITSLIGWWGVVRIEARASLLLEERGVSTELIASLFEEFGPKISLLLFTLALCCALSAYALGRGIARPLERLVAAAEGIARRRGRGPLPPPQDVRSAASPRPLSRCKRPSRGVDALSILSLTSPMILKIRSRGSAQPQRSSRAALEKNLRFGRSSSGASMKQAYVSSTYSAISSRSLALRHKVREMICSPLSSPP